MNCTASRAVAIAKAENGTKETGSNINKYAAYIDKNCPGFYNGKKQGVPYCDVFFDYCIIKACDGDYKKAEKVLCQPANSAGAGCVYSYGYYKAAGRTGKTPRLGAQIFFGSSEKTLSHTGMVISISDDGKKITTEEGNSDNQVKQHTYTLGAKGSKIFGFGYPKYDEEPAEKPTPSTEKPADDPKPEKSIDQLAAEVIQGKWGNGRERAEKLTAAGYNYQAVQNRVNEILKAGSSSEDDEPEEPAEDPSGDQKKEPKTYHVHVSTDRHYLRIRSGPGTVYPEIGKLKNGQAVKVYEIKGSWGRIGTGKWASMSYLI